MSVIALVHDTAGRPLDAPVKHRKITHIVPTCGCGIDLEFAAYVCRDAHGMLGGSDDYEVISVERWRGETCPVTKPSCCTASVHFRVPHIVPA